MTGTDIAFRKPATASSSFDYNHRPEYLTNGQSCTKEGTWKAAATQTENNPWFRVDLQGMFYIRTVVLTPRNSEFTEKPIL